MFHRIYSSNHVYTQQNVANILLSSKNGNDWNINWIRIKRNAPYCWFPCGVFSSFVCVCVASAVQYNIQFKCLYGLHHQLDMRLNLITWITFRWIFCVQFSPGWYALCLNAILCTDNIYSSSATLVHSFQTLNVLHIYSSVQKYARITLLWMNRLTNERQPQTEIQKPSSCRF